MRARIERDWMRNAVKVWLYQPGPNNTITVIGFGSDGQPVMTNVPTETSEPVVPSFVVPVEALEALVKEASGVLPASDATVDALRDTRETRDRLLTIVERTTAA